MEPLRASVVYVMSLLAGLQEGVVLGLLGLACAATIWMLLKILKDPYITDKTFDSQFYQDRDDIRRNGTEGSP